MLLQRRLLCPRLTLLSQERAPLLQKLLMRKSLLLQLRAEALDLLEQRSLALARLIALAFQLAQLLLKLTHYPMRLVTV